MRLLDGIEREEEQYRSTAAAIDTLDEDERLLVMRAVPYDVEADVGNQLRESFAPGAFAKAAKDRIKLWFGHSNDGGHIVGQAEQVEDRADGLWVRAKVSRTPTGDELLTLARDGVLDEASIEFMPMQKFFNVIHRVDGTTVVRHKRATLRGVGLVPHGAYGRHAVVTSVRADREDARLKALAYLQSLTS